MEITTLYKIKIKQEINKLSKIEDPIYLYKHAINTKNIEVLDFIIEKLTKLKNIHFLFLCASDIEKINISKIEDSIISLDGYKYLPDFANYIKGANISKIEDTLISYGNITYIIDFINNVKEANKEKIQNYVIETSDPSKIYMFALKSKYSDILLLNKEIIISKDKYYINLFKEDILLESPLIPKLADFDIEKFDNKTSKNNKQKTLKKR